jgi:hypothetical protein
MRRWTPDPAKPADEVRNTRRVSLHDDPCIDLRQVEAEDTVTCSGTHVVRGAKPVVVQFPLNLHLRVVTDRAFVENSADGELRGCHGVCIVVQPAELICPILNTLAISDARRTVNRC